MEALLSLALDNLSSASPEKIKKGLRQVELLLAQICLPKSPPKTSVADKRRSVIEPPPTRTADKRRSMIVSSTPTKETKAPIKPLSELKDDAAFREFFKLQDGFEWNIATRLVALLERLMGKRQESNEVLIASILELTQGILLLHPPSRRIFCIEANMNILLDLLDPESIPRVQCATIVTLVTALLSTPTNTRLFEAQEGLLTLLSLMSSSSTPQSVKVQLIEFFYFYLMPEEPSIPGSRGSALINRSPSKLAAAFGKKSSNESMGSDGGEGKTKTTREKQALLRKYSGHVVDTLFDDIVRDLEGYNKPAPFGGLVT